MAGWLGVVWRGRRPFIAQNTALVSSLRPGYRTVPLLYKDGRRIPGAFLLVHIQLAKANGIFHKGHCAFPGGGGRCCNIVLIFKINQSQAANPLTQAFNMAQEVLLNAQ